MVGCFFGEKGDRKGNLGSEKKRKEAKGKGLSFKVIKGKEAQLGRFVLRRECAERGKIFH